jgi:hypothetical protein
MPWPFTTTTKDQEPTTRLPSQEDTLIQPPDGPTNGWEVPEEPTATFLAPDAPAEGVLVGQGILGESVSALEPEPPTQVDNLDTWLERMKEAQRALTTAPPEPEPLVPEVPPTPATVVLDERALWSEVDQAMRDGDGARLRELVGATEQDPLEEHTVWSDPIAEAPTENSVSAYLDAGSMDPRESEARLRGFIDTLKVRLERLESRMPRSTGTWIQSCERRSSSRSRPCTKSWSCCPTTRSRPWPWARGSRLSSSQRHPWITTS